MTVVRSKAVPLERNPNILTDVDPKRRKIRCTGCQPCEICLQAKSACSYTAAYTRGRLKPVQRNPSSRLQNDLDGIANTTPKSTNIVEPKETGWEPSASTLQEPGYPDLLEETLSRESPEPVQTDLVGQYIGPASGISFLLRARRRLQQQPATGATSIFTFDDAPLPEFDPEFRMTLPELETTKLAERYFDFVSPVDRFLYRPAVQGWLEAFHEAEGHLGNGSDGYARLALLYMIFAMAQDHTSPKPTSAASDIR